MINLTSLTLQILQIAKLNRKNILQDRGGESRKGKKESESLLKSIIKGLIRVNYHSKLILRAFGVQNLFCVFLECKIYFACFWSAKFILRLFDNHAI